MKPKLSKNELNKQIKTEAEENVKEIINRKRLLFIYVSCILIMATLFIIDSGQARLSRNERGATIIVFGIVFAFTIMTDLPIRLVRKIPIKRTTTLLLKEVYEYRRIIDERINSAPTIIKEKEENIEYYQKALERFRLECEEDIKSAEEEIEILEHEVKQLHFIRDGLFPI